MRNQICFPSKIYKQYNKGDILSKARTFSTTKDCIQDIDIVKIPVSISIILSKSLFD